MAKQYRLIKEVRADGGVIYSVEEKTIFPSGNLHWVYVGGSMTTDEAVAQRIYRNLLDGLVVGKIILDGEGDAE